MNCEPANKFQNWHKRTSKYCAGPHSAPQSYDEWLLWAEAYLLGISPSPYGSSEKGKAR